jgi:serpin B
MRSYVDGNLAFTLELQAALAKTHGNLILSPHSLAAALAVAQAGARSQTQAQIARTAHFPTNQTELPTALARVHRELARIARSKSIEIDSATGLWAQQNFGFERSYVDLVRQQYGAGVEFVDFNSSAGSVARQIDSWISRQTRGKIKRGMPASAVTSRTRLVLANAIYFKGDWASRFAKNATRAQAFWTSATASVSVPMMRQEHDFLYAEADGVQLVELPYVGRDLSMIVMLPRERDGLARLEASLDASRLKAWSRGFMLCKVDLELPRFSINSALSLIETLRSLGMTDAFDDDRADFTGMTARRPLWIQTLEQSSIVEVNEEGTVAASATRIGIGGCSAPAKPPRRKFHANHPFLFFIRENSTGAILFFGRVVDPTR